MAGLEYNSGEERTLYLPSSPPFGADCAQGGAGRGVRRGVGGGAGGGVGGEGGGLDVEQAAANFLNGLDNLDRSDTQPDEELGELPKPPSRPRKQASQLLVVKGVTTRSQSGVPLRRPASPLVERPPRQPAARRTATRIKNKAILQPKGGPPRPITPEPPPSMSQRSLPSRSTKPRKLAALAAALAKSVERDVNPFVTATPHTVISSDSIAAPEEPTQSKEANPPPPPKRRRKVLFSPSDEEELPPPEEKISIVHETLFEGERLGKRSKTLEVAHKVWYQVELLSIKSMLEHTEKLGLQHVVSSRLANVMATGGGPGAFKATDIELMCRRDWEDLVDVLKHQIKNGRKHLALDIVTHGARHKNFVPIAATPPPTSQGAPTTTSTRRDAAKEARPPIVSASKRDFESTQKTRAALMSELMDRYDCKRRCNGSSKYCLVEGSVHHAITEVDFTSLIDSIELSRLTSTPLTVEEPGEIWKERVIRACELWAAKKKKEKEKEPQPALATLPPYYAQSPWFAPSPWPPPYQQQNSVPPPPQPQPQPPPPGGSPSRKSSPVNSDPDINHLEQYCDWLGRRYPRYQKGLEEAKEKLVDDYYTITTLYSASDARLMSLLGKGGLVILLKRYIKEF